MQLRKFKPCQKAVMDFSKEHNVVLNEVKLYSHIGRHNRDLLPQFQNIFF